MSALQLAVLALACALAGCSTADPSDAADAGMTLSLNGEPWASTGPAFAAHTVVGVGVFAERWLEGRYPLYRRVGFSVPASAWAGVGRYPLDFEAGADGRSHAAYFVESDGDVSIALYDPVGGGGAFEVTHYDEATGAFEGRFEGVFAVRPDHAASPRRELPDTLRVTDGRFRTVLDDRR